MIAKDTREIRGRAIAEYGFVYDAKEWQEKGMGLQITRE